LKDIESGEEREMEANREVGRRWVGRVRDGIDGLED